MSPNHALAGAAEQPQRADLGFDSTPWQEYRRRLDAFVRRRVRNEAAADDIVQDIMIKAHRRLDTLTDRTKLRPWLYQIARNALVDYHRARREEPIPEGFDARSIESVDSAERELAHCLVPMLGVLAAPYRVALTLADFDRRNLREVATRLGLSLSGAKSRVQRARTMLRDAFLQCCHIERDRRGNITDYEPRTTCGRCTAHDALHRVCA
jgi:RNA polymerase sigma-70 factor, ECF subfamily